MTSTTKRKEHPMSMRLPASDVAVIDRAASLRGRSRTDFVREARLANGNLPARLQCRPLRPTH